MILVCSIKNLSRKINKSKHVLTVINLYFYSKLVAVVSYLSTLKSQINILSVIISWCLSQGAFVLVCLLVGSLLFHSASSTFKVLRFLDSLVLIMYLWCLLFSQLYCIFFTSLQTYSFANFPLPSDLLSIACYIFEARQLGYSGSHLEFIFLNFFLKIIITRNQRSCWFLLLERAVCERGI